MIVFGYTDACIGPRGATPGERIWMIHATVVHAAHMCGAQNLLYLGSSCIYPREFPQPIREGYLLTTSLMAACS